MIIPKADYCLCTTGRVGSFKVNVIKTACSNLMKHLPSSANQNRLLWPLYVNISYVIMLGYKAVFHLVVPV